MKKLSKGRAKMLTRLRNHIKAFHLETKDFDLKNEVYLERYQVLLKHYNALWIGYCNSYKANNIGKYTPNSRAFYDAIIKPNIKKLPAEPISD